MLLTEEGMILRKRAEEILSLVQQTEEEITRSDEAVVGDVYIGAGETDIVRLLRPGRRGPCRSGTRTSATTSPAATRSTCWNTWTRG